MSRAPANTRLVGQVGGVADLDTPALLIDLAAFRRNLARMADHTAAAGLALRPHVKTHKSSVIAQAQIDAGAIGVSCATIDEAEVMAGAGLSGILITAPLVGAGKIARLMALAAAGGPTPTKGAVMVVADHPDDVRGLDHAAAGLGFRLGVLVDLDIGQHRTGCPTPAAAVRLARAIMDAPHLRLAGLQAYGGHIQHLHPRSARSEAVTAAHRVLDATLAAASVHGVSFPIVTGAGTGTYDLDSVRGRFTELQAGSYLFMDVEYGVALTEGTDAPPFEPSLFVLARVIGTHQADYRIVDAGLKAFATEGGPPHPVDLPRSHYGFFGDEHGKLFAPDPPPLGSVVRLQPPHCDPTVHLYDWYHGVEGDTLVTLWPIDARGRR